MSNKGIIKTEGAELADIGNLFGQISGLIDSARTEISIHANSVQTMTFWNVGKIISENVLGNERAEYGKRIVATLSQQLVGKYGAAYSVRNLRRMMQFSSLFTDVEIVSTLSTQLTWSHFLELILLENNEQRLYYAQRTAEGQLGVRALRKLIDNREFHRREISNTQLGEGSVVPLNTFKNPYLLDFIDLHDNYAESDLENAILHDLEKFILEFGNGFTYVERQKRMIVGGEDFKLDLLFYHRKLRRLVAVELKTRKFQPKDKGQMEFYLKWLDKYEKVEGEEAPIGLILCAEADAEQVELLEMDKDGIAVAQYLTDLPPKKDLQAKVHQLYLEAQERVAIRGNMIGDDI